MLCGSRLNTHSGQLLVALGEKPGHLVTVPNQTLPLTRLPIQWTSLWVLHELIRLLLLLPLGLGLSVTNITTPYWSWWLQSVQVQPGHATTLPRWPGRKILGKGLRNPASSSMSKDLPKGRSPPAKLHHMMFSLVPLHVHDLKLTSVFLLSLPLFLSAFFFSCLIKRPSSQ